MLQIHVDTFTTGILVMTTIIISHGVEHLGLEEVNGTFAVFGNFVAFGCDLASLHPNIFALKIIGQLLSRGCRTARLKPFGEPKSPYFASTLSRFGVGLCKGETLSP